MSTPATSPIEDNAQIEVEVTGPEDFHCFRLILKARPDLEAGERHPIEIMIHARALIELIHKCSLALSDWQAKTSELLLKRLAGTAAEPIGVASKSTHAPDPVTEIPGFTEKDFVAQSECVRFMITLQAVADAEEMVDIADIQAIVWHRLLFLAQSGVQGGPDAATLSTAIETARTRLLDHMANDICPCDTPHCEGCGCCIHRACEGGCTWATPTLCSRCV